MPSLAKTTGLILVLLSPAWSAAQTPGGYGNADAATGSYYGQARPSWPQQPDNRGADPGWRGGGGVVLAGHEAEISQTTGLPADQPNATIPHPFTPQLPVEGQSERSLSLPAKSLPLASPDQRGSAGSAQSGLRGGLPSLVTVASSLAVVLGLFLLVAWVVRQARPGGSVVLPGEVVELLGRTALAGRHQLHLLRCGRKLLLVSVSQDGMETLTEITEPEEVDRLAGLCQQARSDSATAAFRQVFGQLAGHATEGGDV